jgi:hypothetical protein
MDWKDVGSAVANAAPIIGGILGGPIGGAAGGLVKLLAGHLGLSESEATPDKFMEVLSVDPNAMLKFKEFEMAHQVELERLALEETRLYLGDVQSARTRQVETEKALGKRDINLYILAWLVVGMFFTLVGMLMWVTLPEMNIGPVNQLFGAMATGFGMVLQYFFGSSKGSADKTHALSDIKTWVQDNVQRGK